MKHIILLTILLLSCGPKVTHSCAISETRRVYNPKRDTTTSIKLEEIDSLHIPYNNLTISPSNYPIHPDCENKNYKKCFVDILSREAKKHLTNELAESLELSPGKYAIRIFFELDNVGDVKNISGRAPYLKLEEEVVSMINKIPKMKPYLKNNTPSNLKFRLTIYYSVE